MALGPEGAVMRQVSLVLASGPGFPHGSPEHRYEVSLDLDANSRMNAELWYADPRPWPAQRCWPGEPPRHGTVQHDEEAGWSLHFPARAEVPGDASLHCRILTTPFLRPGEYITLREPDGVDHGYRIVQVA